MKNFKISFCTVCMNRVDHLMITLPQNIQDNCDYENVEFVLLDYNSRDGLEGFIHTSMNQYLRNGRLIYYKTTNPQFFCRSHSRNLAFKLSSGEIICNIDADNFTGKGFADYVNREFNKCEDTVLFVDSFRRSDRDILGRICVRKVDFERVRGYDERMEAYGFEDHDFLKRLERSGAIKIPIDGSEYLKSITHDDKKRILNEGIHQNLYKILFHYISPSQTEFLYLFKNGAFSRGNAVGYYHNVIEEKIPEDHSHKPFPSHEPFSILEDCWTGGNWSRDKECFVFTSSALKFVLYQNMDCFRQKDNGKIFYEIINSDLILRCLVFYSCMSNKYIMKNNNRKNTIEVNLDGYGRDTVYRNFMWHDKILVN